LMRAKWWPMTRVSRSPGLRSFWASVNSAANDVFPVVGLVADASVVVVDAVVVVVVAGVAAAAVARRSITWLVGRAPARLEPGPGQANTNVSPRTT
jgi:hypothetical protein